jgi:hypothetical protein
MGAGGGRRLSAGAQINCSQAFRKTETKEGDVNFMT